MKKILIFVLGSLILLATIQLPVNANSIIPEICEIEVRAANIEYRYKSVNGKIYRRLYDLTNQKWIGDWELCP